MRLDMTILVGSQVTRRQMRLILDTLRRSGCEPFVVKTASRFAVGVRHEARSLHGLRIESLPGVERVLSSSLQYPLASRECHPGGTVVDVSGVRVGGREFVVFAGPCAVEDERTLLQTAVAVERAGARVLRGGAFKPRTSPYSFQGLGRRGLRLLSKARQETGLRICTEVLDTRDVGLVAEHADVLQIGSRNMSNFSLLKSVGRAGRPVLLKRGMSAKVGDLLRAAEYVLCGGNPHVILCERGLVSFDVVTRNVLDVACVPVVKALSHLPIIVDPSHAAGFSEYVAPLARAAIAVGGDGLIVEVHPCPERALCDGRQSITTDQFRELMRELAALGGPLGRTIGPAADGPGEVRSW